MRTGLDSRPRRPLAVGLALAALAADPDKPPAKADAGQPHPQRRLRGRRRHADRLADRRRPVLVLGQGRRPQARQGHQVRHRRLPVRKATTGGSRSPRGRRRQGRPEEDADGRRQVRHPRRQRRRLVLERLHPRREGQGLLADDRRQGAGHAGLAGRLPGEAEAPTSAPTRAPFRST